MDNILQYWAQNTALTISAKHYESSDQFERDIDFDRYSIGGSVCRVFPERFDAMGAKLDAVGGCLLLVARGAIYTINNEGDRIRDAVRMAMYHSEFDIDRFIDHATNKETFRIVDDSMAGIGAQLELMEKHGDYVADPFKLIPELIERLRSSYGYYVDTVQNAYDKYLAERANLADQPA